MIKILSSMFVRGISILSKFFLVILLTKYLLLSEYGTFQLISYSIMLSMYLYGMEYYMIANREISKNPSDKTVLHAHISFVSSLFPFILILQILFLFWILPATVLSWLIILLITIIGLVEYFNQEVYRYLIALQKVQLANLLLIVKSLTFLLLILLFIFVGNQLTIKTTIYIMFVSYMILLVLSIYLFKFNVLGKVKITFKKLTKTQLDTTKKSLLPFVILMLFSKGIEFFDKFAVNYYYDAATLGIYAFYFSIASLVGVFVVSGLYLIYLPKLIQHYEKANNSFKTEFQRLVILTVLFSALFTIMTIIFIEPLLIFVDKTEFIVNLDLLYILLIAFNILNISLLPNLLLYVAGKESTLMKVQGIAFVLNLVFNIILLKYIGFIGSAYALVITNFALLFLKLYEGKKVWKTKIARFS